MAVESTSLLSNDYSGCNVLGINLNGDLVTYLPTPDEEEIYSSGSIYDSIASEEIVWHIESGELSDEIKAIIISVDSPGGQPVAGEEVADAIKNSDKPVVAFIRQVGTSAGYWAISSADRIFASKNSDVGSIGVTSSYTESIDKDKKFIQLSSGKFKDAGNPDKPLTSDEKELFMRDVRVIHKNFIEEIAKNRNLPVEEVSAIADGSSVLGEQAKSLGLIDEIGGLTEVEEYVDDLIGERPETCWE